MAYENLILDDTAKKIKMLKGLWLSRAYQTKQLRKKAVGMIEQSRLDGNYKVLRDCLADLHEVFPDWGGITLPKK